MAVNTGYTDGYINRAASGRNGLLFIQLKNNPEKREQNKKTGCSGFLQWMDTVSWLGGELFFK
jgi:hypothetical protein